MKLYFYTKDHLLDYPNIGWIPRLNGVNPDIMNVISKLNRFHAGEYPEIILFRRGNAWALYLSAFNSGRRDYVNRTIQVTLVITAQAGDSFSEKAYSLIQQYVAQLSTGTTSITFLQDFFAQHIQPGQPEQWSGEGAAAQEAVSESLKEALFNRLPGAPTAFEEKTPQCWYGGAGTCSQEFLDVCRNLIFNPASGSGAAMSLPNIGPASLSDPQLMYDALNPLGISQNAVFLLADRSESSIQHTGFVPCKSKKEINPESEQDMKYKIPFVATAVAAIILLISLIVCNNSLNTLKQENQNLKDRVLQLEKENQTFKDKVLQVEKQLQVPQKQNN